MTRDGATTGSRVGTQCASMEVDGWKACSVMRDGIAALKTKET